MQDNKNSENILFLHYNTGMTISLSSKQQNNKVRTKGKR